MPHVNHHDRGGTWKGGERGKREGEGKMKAQKEKRKGTGGTYT